MAENEGDPVIPGGGLVQLNPAGTDGGGSGDGIPPEVVPAEPIEPGQHDAPNPSPENGPTDGPDRGGPTSTTVNPVQPQNYIPVKQPLLNQEAAQANASDVNTHRVDQ